MSTRTANDTARADLSAGCPDVREAERADAVDGVDPQLVVRPTSTDEVSAALRVASEHGLTVVTRGRGTKIGWGLPPESVDLVLDLSRMDRVLDHAAGDLIVEAQAGTPLATVQATVSDAGQRLVVDEVVPGGTVGGTLSTNTSGPLRLSGGTMRDLLIGLTVVRADGVVAKAGGRVVKNVAGYDLGKLMVGSFGTLAVVTEALFRVHPVPEARRWVSVRVPDADRAHACVQEAVHAQVVPAAVEVDWPHERAGSVTVLLEGRAKAVEGRAVTTRNLLGGDATVSDEEPDGWATYPWDLAATGDDRATALKLTFVISGLPDVLATAGRAGVALHLRGSAGAGVVHAAVPAGVPVEDVSAAVEALRQACARHGGTLVVRDASAAVKQHLDVWGPVPGLDLMRRVKDQFDPDRRLSPGRFVGGI